MSINLRRLITRTLCEIGIITQGLVKLKLIELIRELKVERKISLRHI